MTMKSRAYTRQELQAMCSDPKANDAEIRDAAFERGMPNASWGTIEQVVDWLLSKRYVSKEATNTDARRKPRVPKTKAP
jgi:hypothetical protein